MENTQISMLGWPGYSTIWRVGNVGDWRRGDAIFLGMLQDETTDLTVMILKSPKLTIRALDPSGKPLAKFKPQVSYTDQSLAMPPGHGWLNDIKGDVGLESSADGQAWTSTEMLLPNREFNIWVNADKDLYGNSSHLILKEGEEREVTITLKQQKPEQ